MCTSDSDDDDDSSEYYDSESNQLEQINYGEEFEDADLEKLVNSEGPQKILQLILQEQRDEFMTEEFTDAYDYADWIRWASDAEQSRQAVYETTQTSPVPLLLQQISPIHDSSIPVLLQAVQVKDDDFDYKPTEKLTSSNHQEVDNRWGEICQRIKIDPGLDDAEQQQIWGILGRYQNVFAWNKGELGYCTIGDHCIDTQGFPPCRVTPGRLSYWEEAEVKRQIDVLVDLGKMTPSNSEYACRVTLPVKKDGSRRFCGDYRPLNAQTRRDSFPMPLVEDVIDQLGKSSWFTALDLQSGFWQIRMDPEDSKKTAIITKTGLYDWTIMPFGLKNATSTFTRTMSEVFKDLGSRFLKVFVDDLNVHSESWGEHLQHLDAVLCRLREVNLKLNPSKCCFVAKSITFLGHVVSKEGTKPNPGKVEAVVQFPIPKTVTSVRSFLGLTGYYRKYIRGYSRMAGLLFELTKKDVAFVWDVGCGLSAGVPRIEGSAGERACAHTTGFQKNILAGCRLVAQGCWSHTVAKGRQV